MTCAPPAVIGEGARPVLSETGEPYPKTTEAAIPRSWPYDRRPHARPSWGGGVDEVEVALGDWARSPCDDPKCRWLAADDLALLFDEVADIIGLLALVLTETGSPNADAWRGPLATARAEADAAAAMASRLSEKANG